MMKRIITIILLSIISINSVSAYENNNKTMFRFLDATDGYHYSNSSLLNWKYYHIYNISCTTWSDFSNNGYIELYISYNTWTWSNTQKKIFVNDINFNQKVDIYAYNTLVLDVNYNVWWSETISCFFDTEIFSKNPWLDYQYSNSDYIENLDFKPYVDIIIIYLFALFLWFLL